MKVLHIIPTLASGGAEKMLVDIVEEMKKYDIGIEILVLSKIDDFYSDKIKKLGIPLHFGKYEKIYHFFHISTIRNFIKKGGFDIIHTHLFAPQLFTAIAKFFTFKRFKLVTTEHSTHNRRREITLFRFLDKWMYSQYDKIIAITDGVKLELTKYLPFTLNKTIVINNGIKLDEYKNANTIDRKQLVENYNQGDILILMVAAMRSQKDHETVIRATKLLPENYHILFVGDGERTVEVKDYAKKYGSPNIHFLGRRSDVPSIMKSSDIFVLSSHWEGFGLVAVEAMATGLPVIASDVVGLREVVSNARNLFNVGDEKDLSEKVQGLALARNYKEPYNLERFSIQNTVKKYIQVYRG